MLFLVESKMSRIAPYFCAALFMVAGVSKAFLPATAVMALEGLGLSRSLAEAVVLVVASFEIYLATNLLVFPNSRFVVLCAAMVLLTFGVYLFVLDNAC